MHQAFLDYYSILSLKKMQTFSNLIPKNVIQSKGNCGKCYKKMLLLFKVLIGSHFEHKFISHSSQRSLLIKLTEEFMIYHDISSYEICKCGTSQQNLILKTFFFANILLNNYFKVARDKIARKCKDDKIKNKKIKKLNN